jgi:PilZ domain
MDSGFVERRRSPRVSMGSGATVVRPVSMAVRLLDLSSGGVLLSCPDPLPPDAQPRVVARLGSRPLDAELDVRHVSREWDPRVGGYRVGGRFVSLGPQARQAVDGLLAGSEPHE